MSWRLVFTKQAEKDAKKLARAGLRFKAEELLAIITPPRYEKLVGDLAGDNTVSCTRSSRKRVKVIRLWTHYE